MLGSLRPGQRGIYQVIGIGANAREGGAAETAGNVVMFLSNGSSGGGVVMVRYSAPLAKGTMPMLALDGGDASIGPSRSTWMMMRTRSRLI